MADVATARLGSIRAAVAEAGTILFLTGRIIVSAVRPPITDGGELVDEFLFVLRVAWLPMVSTTVAISYGPGGIETASFLNLFGALDRLGGLFVIAVVREFAPLVCAVVVAGAAGTAICADLGARKIREEIDALMDLGVDPIKNLDVARFLALVLVTSLFDDFAFSLG